MQSYEIPNEQINEEKKRKESKPHAANTLPFRSIHLFIFIIIRLACIVLAVADENEKEITSKRRRKRSARDARNDDTITETERHTQPIVCAAQPTCSLPVRRTYLANELPTE